MRKIMYCILFIFVMMLLLVSICCAESFAKCRIVLQNSAVITPIPASISISGIAFSDLLRIKYPDFSIKATETMIYKNERETLSKVVTCGLVIFFIYSLINVYS